MITQTTRGELKADVVLGIGAHADDMDFLAAGTIAKLAAEGAEVYYLIVTDSGKGSADPDITSEKLVQIRQEEQRRAAKILGVKDVIFLDYEDGALEVTMKLKKDIVRCIRQFKPDVVITIDPTMFYNTSLSTINHPDHRACGQAVLDAVFPLARDRLTFPELLLDGLNPHNTKTLLMINPEKQDFIVDISRSFDLKMMAIQAHASQLADVNKALKRFPEQAAALGAPTGCKYAEGFMRLDIA